MTLPREAIMDLPWRDEEKVVLDKLSREKQMSPFGIILQALRLYHLHDERLSAGETCSYSGDEKRRLEFVGDSGEPSK